MNKTQSLCSISSHPQKSNCNFVLTFVGNFEPFAELKEAIIFVVIVCRNERIQIKTNEWKRQMDKIQERSGTTCAESIANQGTSFGP